MKVQITQSFVDAMRGVFRQGRIYSVSDKQGAEWVAAGMAERVPEVECAAVTHKPRGRRRGK